MQRNTSHQKFLLYQKNNLPYFPILCIYNCRLMFFCFIFIYIFSNFFWRFFALKWVFRVLLIQQEEQQTTAVLVRDLQDETQNVLLLSSRRLRKIWIYYFWFSNKVQCNAICVLHLMFFLSSFYYYYFLLLI